METVAVSVRAGPACVDLILPAAAPVAELEPDLRSLLGADGHLGTLAGPLDPAQPVGDQVAPGSLLLLMPTPRRAAAVVYDDPVEAVAATPAPCWRPGDTRAVRISLTTICALLVAAGLWRSVGPTALGVLLLVGGLAGFLARGAVGLPPLVAGATITCVTLLADRLGLSAPVLYLGVGAAAALAAGGAATVGVGLTLTPDPVDAVARLPAARELVTALLAAVTGPLVLAALAAPSLGWAGSAAAGCACLLTVLRARRHSARPERWACLVPGLTGLAVLAAATLTQPVTLLLLTLAPAVPLRPSLRGARCLDLAENALVLAIPGLVAMASGLLAAVAR